MAKALKETSGEEREDDTTALTQAGTIQAVLKELRPVSYKYKNWSSNRRK